MKKLSVILSLIIVAAWCASTPGNATMGTVEAGSEIFLSPSDLDTPVRKKTYILKSGTGTVKDTVARTGSSSSSMERNRRYKIKDTTRLKISPRRF